MPVISGATVTYTDYSAPGTPRVLEVPDAAGDITAQDIWDTLSEEAAKLENLCYKKLINRPNSGGKNELRASPLKEVDITIEMNNLEIHFEDLGGPSYTTKEISGGNILAVDHLGAKIDPMKNSAFVNWKLVEDTAGVLLSGGITAGQAAQLTLIEQILRNKMITDPDTGIMTLYDDAGNPLMTAQLYEGKTTAQTYRGDGAERRERLT